MCSKIDCNISSMQAKIRIDHLRNYTSEVMVLSHSLGVKCQYLDRNTRSYPHALKFQRKEIISPLTDPTLSWNRKKHPRKMTLMKSIYGNFHRYPTKICPRMWSAPVEYTAYMCLLWTIAPWSTSPLCGEIIQIPPWFIGYSHKLHSVGFQLAIKSN